MIDFVYEPGEGIRPVSRLLGTWTKRAGAMDLAQSVQSNGLWKLTAGDVVLHFASEETALRAAGELASRTGEQWLVQLYPDTFTIYMQPYEPAVDKSLLTQAVHTFLLGA